MNLGIDAQFAHFASLEMAVLAAGIEDDYLGCGVQISV
jgi:hypothetical protein